MLPANLLRETPFPSAHPCRRCCHPTLDALVVGHGTCTDTRRWLPQILAKPNH
jgi:hypothetical protein